MTTFKNTSVGMLALFLLVQAPLYSQNLEGFVEAIKSADDGERMAARLSAHKLGASAVAALGEIMAGDAREPALTARHALERIVHHAGRPGAESERAPVAAELLKLTAPSKKATVRREAIYLLGFIAGDAEVSKVEFGLWDTDKHVAEATRLTLERVPGQAAVDVLQAAVARAGGQQQSDLLFSLSKKSGSSIIPFLSRYAESENVEIRLTALGGLARQGAEESQKLFQAASGKLAAEHQQRLYNEYLRLADVLVKRERQEPAAQIYRDVARSSPLDFQRERALHCLCPAGQEATVGDLLVGLGDDSERVRSFARRRISMLTGATVTQALVRGYEEGGDGTRPFLLRALSERDRAAAEPFLEAASASSSIELKITALDLLGRLGDPKNEADYLKAIESGSETIRPIALRGYLILAEGQLQKAKRLYGHVLSSAKSRELKQQALLGLIATGDPELIDSIQPFLADPALSTLAAEGQIALARKIGEAGDLDRAEGYLDKIVAGSFPNTLIHRAAAVLRDLGRDPQGHLKRNGFVLDWWVTGPIQDPDGKGLGTKHFAEEAIRLNEIERIGPRRYRWRKLPQLVLGDRVDLVPVFRRSQNSLAYAYAEVVVDDDQDVVFKVGSDDGVAFWLNEERLLFKPESRSFKVDQDSVKGKLVAGKNRLLLKIANGTADWAYSLRITDAQGSPLNLAK